ncbi:MAG TPA: zf-HC2 domain-containing protein [Longimicrobiales bacterium]
MRRHPPDGKLQALLDRELGPAQRLRLRLHLRRCARCAGRYEAVARANADVAGLLSQVGLTVDPAEAWARFVVRSGWRAARPTIPLVGRLLVPAVAGAAAVASYMAWPRPHPTTDLRPADLLERIGEAVNDIVLDLCCADYDGGGLPDDGLLTLNGPGEVVKLVVVYEDVDRNRAFSAGDRLRFVSSRPSR